MYLSGHSTRFLIQVALVRGRAHELKSIQASPHWEMLINMLSKSRRNLSSEISGSLGLQIHHKKSMVKVAPTYRKIDRSKRDNLKTTSPSHVKITVMGSRRRTLESSVSSTKSHGTTLMHVTQNNHYWPKLKKKSQTLTQTLIWNRIREIESLM